MIGRTLAHYKIVAAVGSGGMGQVYRVEHPEESQKLVMKPKKSFGKHVEFSLHCLSRFCAGALAPWRKT